MNSPHGTLAVGEDVEGRVEDGGVSNVSGVRRELEDSENGGHVV